MPKPTAVKSSAPRTPSPRRKPPTLNDHDDKEDVLKEDRIPLQLTLPRTIVKEIKMAALQRDMNVSTYLLECHHAYNPTHSLATKNAGTGDSTK